MFVVTSWKKFETGSGQAIKGEYETFQEAKDSSTPGDYIYKVVDITHVYQQTKFEKNSIADKFYENK